MWRLRAPLLALLLMQVILLASSGVTATKKPLGKQETCNMKNHMIEYLRNNGVQIYERPQISSAACSPEWNTFGTCCDLKTLQTQIALKIKNNNQALSSMNQELAELGPSLRTFINEHIHRRKIPSRTPNTVMGNGISFQVGDFEQKYANAISSDGSLQVAIQDIEFLERLDGEANLYQTRCVKSINELISKSACSICSGRSDDFFNKDGRLSISEPTCRSFLSSCTHAWGVLLRIKSLSLHASSMIRNVAVWLGIDIPDNASEDFAFTMNLDSFITNRNLIPIMKKCGSSPENLRSCSFEHVAALCEQFIHIQAPTYIESSQNMLDESINKTLTIETNVKQIQAQVAAFQVTFDEIAFSSWKPSNLSQIANLFEEFNNKLGQLESEWLNLRVLLPNVQKSLKSSISRNTASKTKLEEFQKFTAQIIPRYAKAYLPYHNAILKVLNCTRKLNTTEDLMTRSQIAGYWNKMDYAMRLLKNTTSYLDRGLNGGNYPKDYFLESGNSGELGFLRRDFRRRVFQEIALPEMPEDPATREKLRSLFKQSMIPFPVERKLNMIMPSKSAAAKYAYTMETVVVPECKVCFDLGSLAQGVLTGP